MIQVFLKGIKFFFTTSLFCLQKYLSGRHLSCVVVCPRVLR